MTICKRLSSIVGQKEADTYSCGREYVLSFLTLSSIERLEDADAEGGRGFQQWGWGRWKDGGEEGPVVETTKEEEEKRRGEEKSVDSRIKPQKRGGKK